MGSNALHQKMQGIALQVPTYKVSPKGGDLEGASSLHLPPQRLFHSAWNFSLSSGVMLVHFSCILCLHIEPLPCQPPLKPPNNILLNINIPRACINVIALTPSTAGNIAFHRPITTRLKNKVAAIKKLKNINPFLIQNFFIVLIFL